MPGREPVLGDCEPEWIDRNAIQIRAYEISLEPGAGSPVENWLRAELELAVVHDYDTVDRDLEVLGITVSRVPVEAGVIWRLRLPRGEKVEAWEPGNQGLAPPAEISELIAAAVAGKQLVPAPPLGGDPGAIRLRELVNAQRTAMLTHDPGVRLRSDPENLHEHRVAARRALAFFRATRAYLDPAWRRSIVEPLGLLTAATGPVRDIDVLLEHLHVELSELEEPDRAGGEALLARLGYERAVARGELLDVLDSGAYRAVAARLRLPPRLAEGVQAVPLDWIARKEFRRLVRAVDRLGKHPADAALHQLRITLKRARYAAELSAGTAKGSRRFLTAAKALQDILGEYQDAVIAEQRLRETTVHDSDTAAAFVAGRIAERQRARRQHVTEHLPAAWKTLRKRGRRL
jgi:CHAD domain-containing protein